MKKSAAANGKAKPAKQRKVQGKAHQLAKPLPEGTVLTDLKKGEWKVGKSIGSGGFGLIYLADQNSTSSVSQSAHYVVKVEPHTNGPLFCELHFYQRAAKPETIREWMSARRLKSLGVPRYIASGNHDRDGTKYRFMVMERFGSDLQKMFEDNSKRFPATTVFLLGHKLVDVLEYLHDNEYVHADVKASNLLQGYTDPEQVYLVDYGLAFRYVCDGEHKPYKEDPKRAHDGTVEFTSRDAHRGVVPSRRGDLEILGYCMLQWLCSSLPWEDNLDDKNYVRDQKIRYMSDVPALMNKCFPGSKDAYVADLQIFLQYIAGLSYTEKPDYTKCRTVFAKALKSLGSKISDPLVFSSRTTTAPSAAAASAKPGKKPAVSRSQPAKSRGKKRPSVSNRDSDGDDDDCVAGSPPKAARKASASPGFRSPVLSKIPAAARLPKPRSPAIRGSPMVVSPAGRGRSPKVTGPNNTDMNGDASSSASSKPAKHAVRVVKKRRGGVNLTTTATQTTPGLARKSTSP